jgi:GPI inositol-deacylase
MTDITQQAGDGDKMLGPADRERSRLRSPWTCSLLTVCTALLSVLLLLAISQSFVTRQRDPKGCRMSYMAPGYAKLEGFDTEHTRFASKYSLHLYREMGVEEDTMVCMPSPSFRKIFFWGLTPRQVKGVPVLFITGNAGSHRQVRSLAAEAARYYKTGVEQDAEAYGSGTRGLDFFTADFNEDLTAFHGQTLLDQAEYLNDAIAYILSLYHDPAHPRREPGLPDPSSVILIAHSMGGVVARTMLTMPNYQANSVNTIITVSTPHARAPVAFDKTIVQTYADINTYWRHAYSQKWANNNPLWHVTLISVAGGGLDTTVPSDYTSISSLVPETHGFTVYTSTIPSVWTGSDHLSILWCRQTTKVIVRALIEAVDVRRPGQTKPRAERMRIFKKWFLTGMEDIAEKSLQQSDPTTLLTLEDDGNSILSVGERLVIRQFGHFGRQRAYLLPIPPQGTPGGTQFTLLSDQVMGDSTTGDMLQVLFCSVFPLSAGHSAALFSMNMDSAGVTSGSTRLACKSASSDVILLPASSAASGQPFDDVAPFSYLQYNLEDLSEHHFVAILDRGETPQRGWLIAEFSDKVNSHSHIRMGRERLLLAGVQTMLPAARPLVNEIKIPAMSSSLLAYRLAVGPQACGDGVELFKPLLRQYVSDPHESKYFVNVRRADINLHGVSPYMPPPLKGHAINDGLSLQFWSDPTCGSSIEISLEVDVLGSMGKLVMRYGIGFLAFPLLVVALVLRRQFMAYDTTGQLLPSSPNSPFSPGLLIARLTIRRHSGVFMPFSEALDLCMRSSLPVLLLAMTILAIALSSTDSQVPDSNTPSLLQPRRNSTDSTADYYKNDLLIGSPNLFFWFLVPAFGFLAAGVCFIVNHAVLLVISISSLCYAALAAKPAWQPLSERRSVGPWQLLLFGANQNGAEEARHPSSPRPPRDGESQSLSFSSCSSRRSSHINLPTS